MKQQNIHLKQLIIVALLVWPMGAFCQRDWRVIVPELWASYVPDHYYVSKRKFNNDDYTKPYAGNVAIPPYIVEKKVDEGTGGVMMIEEVIGRAVDPGGGWIQFGPRRSGYSENGGAASGSSSYGAFYQADIDTLRLPATLKRLWSGAFNEAKVKVVVCAAFTPPVLESSQNFSFDELIVPTGCLEAYRQADMWGQFTTIKEGAEELMPEQLVEADGAWYRLTDGCTACLVNSDQSASDLVIPETILYYGKNYAVTELGTASVNRYHVSSLTFGSNMKDFHLSSLQNTLFHEDGGSGYYDYKYNAVQLSAIHVSADHPNYSSVNGALYTKDGKTLLYLPKVVEITKNASDYYYTIPDGVTTIKSGAFPKLTPDNFEGRQNFGMGTVIVPPSVTRIEQQDVAWGFSLQFTSKTPPEADGMGNDYKGTIYTPKDCLYDYLDKWPFSAMTVKEKDLKAGIVPLYTDMLTAYWMPDEQYYDLASYKTDKTEVTLPSELYYGLMSGPVKTLGKCYFSVSGNFSTSNSESLQSLTIPEGIEEIYCRGNFGILRQLTLPSTVRIIGPYSFRGSKYLQKVTVAGALETIGNYAFSGCTELTEVQLPATMKEVGFKAFNDCTSLKDVRLEGAVPPHFFFTWKDRIEVANARYNDFFSCPVASATLHVPAGAKDIYMQRNAWKEFGTIIDDMPKDETAGVNSTAFNVADSYYIHDLQGRRISMSASSCDELPKGLYIINGKKIVKQ